MAIYLITLFPIERFYFGSDVTFGEKNENYFVRSAYFPQQTTLLGMLRYYLLQQNDFFDNSGKIKKPNDLNRIIGVNGFDPNKNGSFGIISEISPVFIVGPEGEYFVQSREYGLKWKEDEISGEKKQELIPLKIKKQDGQNSFSKNNTYYMDGLDAKTVLPDLLVNSRTGHMRYFDYNEDKTDDPMNGVFIPCEQIGIKKPLRGSIDVEKGFYKQIGYNLKQNFGFAFFASIDINISNGFKIEPGLVKMGADQSWFKIECKIVGGDVNNNINHLIRNLYKQVNDQEKKIVLLSDTYLESESYNCNKIPFASTSTISFGYLETSFSKTEPGFSFDREGFKLIKSMGYKTLLKKGSVLYFSSKEDKDNLLKIINDNHAFYQIGYNHAI
jgi:CRISPR-associated protein Cmr3